MATNSRFIRLIKQVERSNVAPIEAAINAQLDYFIKEYKQGNSPMSLPVKPLNKALRAIYEQSGLPNAVFVRGQIKRSTKTFDNIADKLKWMVNEYYNQNLLAQAVVPITETTRRQIATVMQQANEGGWGINKIVSALKNTDLTKNRARLIARTESLKAANAGAMLSAAEMDIAVDKMWVSSQDNRTRRIPRNQYDHLHMNKKQVGFNELFIVPSTKTIDAMSFPGDPNGSAGNVINCRCTVVFVPIKNENNEPVSLRANLPASGVSNVFMRIAAMAASFSITSQIIDSFIESIEGEVFV